MGQRYTATHKKTVPSNHAKGGKGGTKSGGAGGKVGGK